MTHINSDFGRDEGDRVLIETGKLFLNDLKNQFDVKTPDGEAQTLTIGMATAFVDATRCAELIRKA